MKRVIIFVAAFIVFLSKPAIALAHCPLCVAGAGAGLTLSRILGIDDTITGVWLGAFLGATAFWLAAILSRRTKLLKSKIFELAIYVSVVFLTLISFYQFNLVGRHTDIFGYDKLTFGMVVGSVAFYLVNKADIFLRKSDGKHYFAYQKIVVSLTAMTLVSAILYLLLNFYI